MAVNCAAIPRELIESELFGYVGAFSGARREGSAGKFEAADRGTLFLDELAELPPSAQVTLLSVLQEGEVTRVGATQARPVDVRVIAAADLPSPPRSAPPPTSPRPRRPPRATSPTPRRPPCASGWPAPWAAPAP